MPHATNVPTTCVVCKKGRRLWKYSVAKRVHSYHATAFAVQADVIAVLIFGVMYDVSATDQGPSTKKFKYLTPGSTA